jgi:hypothetical protein
MTRETLRGRRERIKHHYEINMIGYKMMHIVLKLFLNKANTQTGKQLHRQGDCIALQK